MLSVRTVLVDCAQIFSNTYGGALRQSIYVLQKSFRRNKFSLAHVPPKIPIKIRCMREEDIPQVMELRRQVRVQDVPSVLQTWLKLDPEGMKVAENENGDIVGSLCLTRNHDDLYFSGIYCIHEKFRGLNIGIRLCAAVLSRVENKNILGNVVNAMVEKYIKAGDLPYMDENFTTVKNYIPNSVTPNVLTNNGLPENIEIEPYQENLLSSIAQYDATIAGFERKHILELSCKEKDSQTLAAFKDGTCIGYGSIKRSCFDAGRVGPLFADDPVVAEALLKKLLESFPQRKGFAMMTLRDNIIANSFIRRLGNPETDTCVRFYNKEKLKVDTSRIYAVTDMNFSAV
ncbi:n-acetyltransferase domain-containing protein [Nephila pilipes]|uniref:N-acetyltransferase domain-containing protein n=1 Tax=Nephila pilipes TaxID=299642 RepID=A0A8X6QSA5_NEPPI|nr:n-acetyltransferase domain-containing protein [Nephila pilipes]